jgi:uncharacterized protein involved in exopolysaccharide biosynthesis
MRRWLKLAIWLYPTAWRARYGREFDALVSDVSPRWRDLWDIVRGAIAMQLSTAVTYFKLGAATAVIGALVAGGVTAVLPKRYVSSALLRITPQVYSEADAERYKILAEERVASLQEDVLSRTSLAGLIQDPELDLYESDRRRYPMEDIIQKMRQQDIRILPVDSKLPFHSAASAFQISFEYPDRTKAQRVVRALVGRFTDSNIRSLRGTAPVSRPLTTQRSSTPGPWQVLFPEAGRPMSGPSPAPSAFDLPPVNLEVIDPANLPDKAIQPEWAGMIAIGVAAGFGLGLLIAYLKRRPLRWTLWIASSAIVGFAGFFGIAIAADLEPAPFAVLGAAAFTAMAAYVLRDRAAWRPVPYAKSALAAAACGGIVGGLVSFAMPEQYVSNAVVRVFQRDAHGVPMADTTGAVAGRFRRTEFEILSQPSLARLIQRPALDLYRHERQRHPMKQVVREMRSDIRFQAAGPSRGTFLISFRYSDRTKAQAVVRELVSELTESNLFQERNAGRVTSDSGGIVLNVLEGASNPELAVWPDRLQFVATGFGAGLPLGLLITFFRRRPPGQTWAMLRFAAASGVAGAVIAAAVSFAIPSRYVSTATLRVRPPEGSEPPDLFASQQVQQRMIEVLSHRSLMDLVNDLDLYPSDRIRYSADELIATVREHDLKIESLDASLPTATTTAFSISFEHRDPVKAHAAVQYLVDKFVENHVTPASLEVLESPTTPELPVSPSRFPIAGIGLVIGVVLGPVAAATRHLRPFAPA